MNYLSWIEQLYKYTEYYYWQPIHLQKQAIPGQKGKLVFDKVRRQMRHNEVPLNTCLNIAIRLMPAKTLKNMLNCFVGQEFGDFGEHVELVDIASQVGDVENFTQPDVTLESDSARIFIEIKIDAEFSLGQIYKYVFLHALWALSTKSQKTPYIFLVSPKKLARQWMPVERPAVFHGDDEITDLYSYLKTSQLPHRLGNLAVHTLHDDARAVLGVVRLGHTTWANLGRCFETELDQINPTAANGDGEVVYKLISDLLVDLKSRELFSDNVSKSQLDK